MYRRAKAAIALGAIGVSTSMVVGTQFSWADDQARGTDVVGVGSDTVQYAADFLADGDTTGDNGYNTLNRNRMITDFATGDGNGRALYDPTGTLLYGNGTTSYVLRAGSKPVERPVGSGAGISALIADTTGNTGYQGLQNNSINFVRASREPKASEQSQCAALANCVGLHVYQFATDQLVMAKDSAASNVPAGGLSAQQLVAIYQCTDTTWTQVGGTSTDTIIPVIPQSGSGTRNFFLADLQAANGGTAITLGTCVKTSEEHDPTGITKASNPADAIEPFSLGKLNLIASGYFSNSQEAASDFNIAGITSGTPSDGNALYDATRGLYFIVRDYDITHAGPFQPGGTQNFVQALFSGATSWIARSSNAALISAAGFTPSYADLGDVSSG